MRGAEISDVGCTLWYLIKAAVKVSKCANPPGNSGIANISRSLTQFIHKYKLYYGECQEQILRALQGSEVLQSMCVQKHSEAWVIAVNIPAIK